MEKVRLVTKNHINIDNKNKIIHKFAVTAPSTHDPQALDDLIDDRNTSGHIYADSAYRSDDIEQKLKDKKIRSRIHRIKISR